MNKEIKEWFLAILTAGITMIFIHTFLFLSYSVSGDSMYPILKDHEKVIVSKISNTLNDIDRGDIIVFHATKNKDYVKRLIGIPGDKVVYKDDVLYINDKKIEEEYLKENRENKTNNILTEDFTVDTLVHSNGSKTIPNGKYLVLGDNREVSMDSRRELGLINKDQVVGKVLLRFYPFNTFKIKFYSESFDKINK